VRPKIHPDTRLQGFGGLSFLLITLAEMIPFYVESGNFFPRRNWRLDEKVAAVSSPKMGNWARDLLLRGVAGRSSSAG